MTMFYAETLPYGFSVVEPMSFEERVEAVNEATYWVADALRDLEEEGEDELLLKNLEEAKDYLKEAKTWLEEVAV